MSIGKPVFGVGILIEKFHAVPIPIPAELIRARWIGSHERQWEPGSGGLRFEPHPPKKAPVGDRCAFSTTTTVGRRTALADEIFIADAMAIRPPIAGTSLASAALAIGTAAMPLN